jgi:hypothetical protein
MSKTMSNLIEETVEKLKDCGKSDSDINWCGSESFGYFTWEDFREIADFEYNLGYGAPEVALDLVIVFKDGSWLERYEYDGAENWVYKESLKKPVKYRKPVALCVDQAKNLGYDVSCGWENLNNLNIKKNIKYDE